MMNYDIDYFNDVEFGILPKKNKKLNDVRIDLEIVNNIVNNESNQYYRTKSNVGVISIDSDISSKRGVLLNLETFEKQLDYEISELNVLLKKGRTLLLNKKEGKDNDSKKVFDVKINEEKKLELEILEDIQDKMKKILQGKNESLEILELMKSDISIIRDKIEGMSAVQPVQEEKKKEGFFYRLFKKKNKENR